jgi:hypothetical protein
MNRYDIAKGKSPYSVTPEMEAIVCAKRNDCGVDCNMVVGFCPAMEYAFQPWTPEEASNYLYAIYRTMSAESVFKISVMSEQEFVIQQHPYLGEGLKHQWGLENENSHLVQYFKTVGIHSVDDMIVIILVSLYRRIKGRKRELAGLIRDYGNFWTNRKTLT